MTHCRVIERHSFAAMFNPRPWFAKYGYTQADLHDVRATEGWHARYGGGVAGAAAGKVDKDAVY